MSAARCLSELEHDESQYTDVYRVMLIERGKSMRQAGDDSSRDAAFALAATLNRANAGRSQTAIVVRVGHPIQRTEIAANGDVACERVVVMRPLLIVREPQVLHGGARKRA